MSQAEIGPCWAGRKAFFGGRWTVPCREFGIHLILSAPGAPEVELCEQHFQQVNAAGLVTMPYVGSSESEARRIIGEAMGG